MRNEKLRNEKLRSVQVQITGRVQGVGFRAATAREANRLEVAGYVCNRSDGAVSVVASGSADSVQQLLQWCESGPPWARVDSVEVSEECTSAGVVASRFVGFEIRRDEV